MNSSMRRINANLAHTTTGLVIFIVLAVGLLGSLRAHVIQANRTPDINGAVLFAEKGCLQCHYLNRKSPGAGPGLKDLFVRDRLPASGLPVSEKNIRCQLRTHAKDMPSFTARLTDKEMDRLIAYLRTL